MSSFYGKVIMGGEGSGASSEELIEIKDSVTNLANRVVSGKVLTQNEFNNLVDINSSTIYYIIDNER